MFLISVILIIFISSFSTINAQQIDENQTDNLELEISTIPGDNLQELPSSSNLSNNPDTNSKKAFLVLDNDVDKENAYVGDYVTWILDAVNLGPDVAKNTKVHDSLPSGLKYISHTATKGTFDPNTGIWDIGDLTIDDGHVTLLIVTKALTVGEKVNKAFITSDTFNTNNETFEAEEMDVFEKSDSEKSFEKTVSAKMYETGNPIFLVICSLLSLMVIVIKR